MNNIIVALIIVFYALTHSRPYQPDPDSGEPACIFSSPSVSHGVLSGLFLHVSTLYLVSSLPALCSANTERSSVFLFLGVFSPAIRELSLLVLFGSMWAEGLYHAVAQQRTKQSRLCVTSKPLLTLIKSRLNVLFCVILLFCTVCRTTWDFIA